MQLNLYDVKDIQILEVLFDDFVTRSLKITDEHNNTYTIKMFADDTCLYIEVDNREAAAVAINEDLDEINNWAKKWLVNFSAPKTKSLVISNKRDRRLNPVVNVGGTDIDEVDN